MHSLPCMVILCTTPHLYRLRQNYPHSPHYPVPTPSHHMPCGNYLRPSYRQHYPRVDQACRVTQGQCSLWPASSYLSVVSAHIRIISCPLFNCKYFIESCLPEADQQYDIRVCKVQDNPTKQWHSLSGVWLGSMKTLDVDPHGKIGLASLCLLLTVT